MSVVFVAASQLPTPFALFTMHGFLDEESGKEHVALTLGDVADGQPVLIGGSMGVASYILAGHWGSKAFASACHSAGRAMSHNEVLRRWKGRAIVAELARRGILIRSPSLQGVAEEAPDAYKDVSAVVHATEFAGLACLVAKLAPVICVKS